jgi:hypothetical protein
MTLELTPELEDALEKRARERGTTPELLALDALRDRFLPAPDTAAPAEAEGTLADFLAGYIGGVRSSEHVPGGARMSEKTGKDFAEALLRKRDAEIVR